MRSIKRLTKLIYKLSVLSLLLIGLYACETAGPKPEPSTPTAESTTPNDLTPLDESHYLKAVELLNDGNAKSSEKSLSRLAKKYPSQAKIFLNLASAQFIQNKFTQASNNANYALTLDKSIAELHNLVGLIAVENKKFKQAEKSYLKAIALNKKFANAQYNIALLYDIYFQDIPQAFSHYTEYLRLQPNDQETRDWVDQLKYSLEQE